MVNSYRFIKGYYTIKLSGDYSGRVINRSMGNKVYIWNLKKVGENNVEFCVSKKGYEIVKEIACENGCILEVLNYNGIDKVMKMLKKRWMFFYAFITVMVCVLVSSSFIWTVDVPDVSYINKEEIVDALSDMGLRAGSFRKTIDYTKVSNALVTKFDSIIWANVELKGTRLKVSLVPRKKAPELVPSNVPTDIIAKKDGVIISVKAENGEKKVQTGDTVVKGQVLISGLVPSSAVGTRYVHSMGEVKATVWTEKTKEQKLYKYEKEYTGNTVLRREVKIPFLKIPLYFKKNIDFYNYESIIKEKNILFLTYSETEIKEYNLKKIPLTIEEAVVYAENELKNEIEKECENILSYKTEYKEIDGETILVRVLSQSNEEIGEERIIE